MTALRETATDDASPAAVSLRDVSKSFGTVHAVEPLSLDVGQGEFFSIIGSSGCGKTTTLRMIAGFESPTTGSIRIGGQDVTALPAYRRPVNTVFQSYALFPNLNVFDNIAFGLREARASRADIRRRVGEAVDLVQLSGRETAKPRQLSGGQQQRVALARALVNRPRVLLLDEPLGALDLKLRRGMQTQLKDLHHDVGITFLYVTHDQEEAFAMSDRVAVMDGGRIEQVGAPEDIYRRPATRFVAEFVGQTNQFSARVLRPAGAGRYEVDVDVVGTKIVCGPPGLTSADHVTVAVRPEDVRLGARVDTNETGILATVVDSAFLGTHRRLRLNAGPLGEVVAVDARQPASVGNGDPVSLSWDDDMAWLIVLGG